MNAKINKEHVESDRASELPFALKTELWNIFSSERMGSDRLKYRLNVNHRVIEIRLQKYRQDAFVTEKTFFWENPIKIDPPGEVWIEIRNRDILMRFPDEN